MIPQREYFDKSIANSDNTDGYYIIEQGDFVYNPRKSSDAPYGPVSIYKHPESGIVSPLYLCFRALKSINSSFYDYFFKSPSWHRYIYLSGDSGARHDRVSIKDDVFFSMPMYIPSEEEQLKVSSFLSLIEKRIADQQQLVEHLKKYKRGVSNTFFNDKVVAECSAVLPFGQAVEINPKTKSLPTEFIYIDLESVESGKLLQENIISRDNAPSRAQRVLTKGDVLFQMVRPYQKNNFYFESELSLPAVASTGYAQIRCVDNDPLFVFEQISSDYFANEAMLRSTGTGYPAINADSLAEIPFIKHPIEEQRKIGKFLYLLSQRIIQEESKLEALLKVKGAMLQSLFI